MVSGVFTPRRLVLEILLPLAILATCSSLMLLMGKKSAGRRPSIGGSPEARLPLLPAAETQPCLSLADIGGVLDIHANGTVVPFREVAQAAEVGGRIVFKSPNCEAGSFVKEGDLLLRIDPTDYQFEVERLEKQLEQEAESIRELQQEVTNVGKLLELARREFDIQTRELQRAEDLPGGFASESEIDRARSAQLQASNQITQMENQNALLGTRRGRLEASRMLVATQLKRAQEDLRRTEIHAAVSGVVVTENAELNSFVQRGTLVVTLEETSRVEVAVDLRMDQLGWVLNQEPPTSEGTSDRLVSQDDDAGNQEARRYRLPRTPVTIRYTINGRESEELVWNGELVRYDGIGLDPQTRTVPVRIVVDQPHRDRTAGIEAQGPQVLVRGMFVDVTMHTRPQTPLVLVPSLGLRPGGRAWKFVADTSVLDRPLPGETADDPSPEKDAQSDSASRDATSAADAPATAEDRFDPRRWQAGRIDVVEDLRSVSVVNVMQGKVSAAASDEEPSRQRYWICEAPRGLLAAGDPVIVTPLAGIAADGSDLVRVPASSETGDLKESPSNPTE